MPTQQEQEQYEQLRQQWEQQHPGQPFDAKQVLHQAQQYEQLQQQQPHSGSTSGIGDIRSQSQFDTAFSEQMFGDSAQREITQAYWQQAEETIRDARRISEVYALSVMSHQLVQKVTQAVVPQLTRTVTPIVTQQVVQQLQQNPQLLKPVVQQAMQSR
jgi:hypothetical protein